MFQLITSGVALGLMSGAVGLHWWQLEAGQEEFVSRGADDDTSTAGGQVIPTTFSLSGDAVVTSVDLSQGKGSPPPPRELEGIVAALAETVAILRDLKEENRELREQAKETNRDLTEMQFQLDTTHRSFRPLKIAEDPVDSGSAGQLHPLLPPKR